MDRIGHLRVFVHIAECGSFTLAADRLALPRASVSEALAQLEAKLGARLLHRTTRRVRLTVDGEQLLERARALVAEMEALERQFRPPGPGLAGRLRIDVPSRIARRLVAPALPQLLALHPALEVELGSSDQSVDLVHAGMDCALRLGPLASSTLVARVLGRFPVVNCASPDYLARYGCPQHVAELEPLGHRMVRTALPAGGGTAPWEWQADGRVHTLDLPASVTANNAEVAVACARAGLGLAQLPVCDVEEHLRSGALVEVLPQARPAPLPVQLVVAHRRHLPARVRTFEAWLRQLLLPHLHP